MMRKKIKYTLTAKVLPFLIKKLIKLLIATCRLRFHGQEQITESAKKNNIIVILWHNRLLLTTDLIYRCNFGLTFLALISKSRDGDALANMVTSYKNGKVLRVAHNARHNALMQTITALKNKKNVVILTPDGPRGPVYEIKPGAVIAAKETKAQVFPYSCEASSFWRLKTWDKFIIPKPFSTLSVTFGPPVTIDEDKSIEEGQKLLKSSLEKVSPLI